MGIPVEQLFRDEIDKRIEETFGIYRKDKVPLAEPDDNEKVWGTVDRSRPNDFIVLNNQEIEKLEDLWMRFLPDDTKESDKAFIPSDLILAGTIPLTDVVLNLDLDDDGNMFTFRIVIFDEYEEIIQRFLEDNEGTGVMVGMCIRQFEGTGNEVGFPILISKNSNYVNNTDVMFYRKIPSGYKQERIPKVLAFLLQSRALSAWYGIQLALLNPVTKETFIRTGKEKYKDSVRAQKAGTYKKGPTRYIRRLQLNTEAFDGLINGTGKTYERHTLAWRVIGHWRHYKDGRTVFIKPYWKGLMKDIQKQDNRQREIVIPNEIAPMVRIQQ